MSGNRKFPQTITAKDAHTWIIDDGGVRLFLLEGSKRAALIDTGMNCPKAKELAESLTALPLMLINTHVDRDHISGNDAFDEVWMSASEMAYYHHSGVHSHTVHGLYEGDSIDLGDRSLEVIALPGHTPGSIGFLDSRNRVLLSGDPIQKHGTIFMFGPQRDLAAAIESYSRILKSKDRFDEIWPSHADLPVDSSVIPGLIDGCKNILAGKLSGEIREMFGSEVLAIDIGDNIILADKDN